MRGAVQELSQDVAAGCSLSTLTPRGCPPQHFTDRRAVAFSSLRNIPPAETANVATPQLSAIPQLWAIPTVFWYNLNSFPQKSLTTVRVLHRVVRGRRLQTPETCLQVGRPPSLGLLTHTLRVCDLADAQHRAEQESQA